MKILFERSFLKDIRKIKDWRIKELIYLNIDEIKKAESINNLHNIKKLKGHKSAYRINDLST
jgi:hypothetical protein